MSECPNAIAVSGRIRLARNYPDLPFSSMERPEDAESCIQRACQAMHTGTEEVYTLHLLRSMTPDDRMTLVDEHLISRDLLKHNAIGAALIRRDEKVSIMMNEEDHLRIQSLLPGNHLREAAEEAFRAEEILEKGCGFSFDPQLGYLTSCPTNTGTGLRASLMLHLPMLTRFKQMGNVNQSVAKLGLTMRGIYGEGSEALGDLYQVSNQITLGRREEDIIDAVTAVGKQLIDLENNLRESCRAKQKAEVEDALWRSYGALRYAVLMNEKEFMQHWSNLRLGSAMGILPTPVSVSDELLSTAQDAHVRQYAKRKQLELPVEQARCALLREALQSSETH